MHAPHGRTIEHEQAATVETTDSGPDGTGWFCMHRKVIKSAVFAVPELLKCCVWCLARANPTAAKVPVKTGRGTTFVELKAGEFITGRESASEALGMPGTTAMDRLRRLEALGVIKLRSVTHFSIVSVVNWKAYQNAAAKARHPSVTQVTPNRHPSVTDNNQTIIQDSPYGESIGPQSSRSQKFVKPTLECLAAYVATRTIKIDPERFIDHYEANGWKVGKSPMKDWRAAVRNWEKNQHGPNANGHQKPASPARIHGTERKPLTVLSNASASA